MQLGHIGDVHRVLSFKKGQIPFTQPASRVKVAGDGFFGDLLPGDVNAKGLKRMSQRMALRQLQKRFISFARLGAGVRGEPLLERNSGIPVTAQLGSGPLKRGLCGQGRIEMHAGGSFCERSLECSVAEERLSTRLSSFTFLRTGRYTAPVWKSVSPSASQATEWRPIRSIRSSTITFGPNIISTSTPVHWVISTGRI